MTPSCYQSHPQPEASLEPLPNQRSIVVCPATVAIGHKALHQEKGHKHSYKMVEWLSLAGKEAAPVPATSEETLHNELESR